MIKLKPFCAVHYNLKKIKELNKVVCPPYDVISTSERDAYYRLNKYNFIRLILGKATSADNTKNSRYIRSRKCLNEWLGKNILVKDAKPSVYFYEQVFEHFGKKIKRIGFISLLKLSQRNKSIFCHEHTQIAPKEDRFQLLKRVKANLSPIFLILNKRGAINRFFLKYSNKRKLCFSFKDKSGITHSISCISNRGAINELNKAFKNSSAIIADGHHRYEVALNYRYYAQRQPLKQKKDACFNYIMAYFTDLSPNLVILPVHRIIKGITKTQVKNLNRIIKDNFILSKCHTKEALFKRLNSSPNGRSCLGLYNQKKFYFLSFKKSPKNRLDVQLLNDIIIEPVLSAPSNNVSFTPYAAEVIGKVNSQRSSLGFFLRPVSVNDFLKHSLNGKCLPSKSTYFYPKLLSGLLLHKFD